VDQSKVAAVAHRVRSLIHDGVLSEGDPLPSTRSLAAELGVARGTVVAAYEQLDGEGYLRTRHGAVARVAHVTASAVTSASASASVSAPPAARSDASIRAAAQPAAPASPTSPAPTATAGAATSRPLLDATPGVPAVTAISPRDWRAAWRAAADLPLRNGSSDPDGMPLLRESIAAQLALSRGFAASPDQVVVTAGTSDALSVMTEALRAALGRVPKIAVEEPGYPGGRWAIRSAGGELVPVPVGDVGLVLEELAALDRVDAVMVTPTHQYPLGSVMPVGRRQQLLAWAASHGVVVIEDDYDSEFRHRGTPMPALAALDRDGVVIHLGGFSKILDPRLRCAYMVLPDAAAGPVGHRTAAAVHVVREARGPVVAEPVQAALAHLLRTGALRRHLGRARRDYSHKRKRILQRLAAASIPGVEAHALNGGLHVVLTWPAEPAASAVVAAMASRGVLVADLADYYARDRGDRNGVVIGYGALTPAELDRSLDLLIEALAV
jgi:DNA-binding transcriptional MocR family regulator